MASVRVFFVGGSVCTHPSLAPVRHCGCRGSFVPGVASGAEPSGNSQPSFHFYSHLLAHPHPPSAQWDPGSYGLQILEGVVHREIDTSVKSILFFLIGVQGCGGLSLNIKTKSEWVSGPRLVFCDLPCGGEMMTGPLGSGGSLGPRGSSCVSLPTSRPLGQCCSLSDAAHLASTWPALGKLTLRGGVMCHGYLVEGGPRSPVLHPPSSPLSQDSFLQGALEPCPSPSAPPVVSSPPAFPSSLLSKVPGLLPAPPHSVPVGMLAIHRVLAPLLQLPLMCHSVGADHSLSDPPTSDAGAVDTGVARPGTQSLCFGLTALSHAGGWRWDSRQDAQHCGYTLSSSHCTCFSW